MRFNSSHDWSYSMYAGSLHMMFDTWLRYVVFSLGFRRHLWDIRAVLLLDLDNVRVCLALVHISWLCSNRRQRFSANGVVYPITIFFAKPSILLLYFRVFKVDRVIRYSILVGIISQALFYSAAVGLAIGSLCRCVGVKGLSDTFCKRFATEIQVMILAVSIATDIYVLILPIYRVSKLRLKFKRKVGILVVFAGGIL